MITAAQAREMINDYDRVRTAQLRAQVDAVIWHNCQCGKRYFHAIQVGEYTEVALAVKEEYAAAGWTAVLEERKCEFSERKELHLVLKP